MRVTMQDDLLACGHGIVRIAHGGDPIPRWLLFAEVGRMAAPH
ncbi:hypothetical protein I551_4123 [Mycobacterium ulcerans str. Harvey]|uniref:Uncharacterized protein n=1 Tax=Mycobacterium ulcerans str. Harvey TaxID=1299332 RepID=A0ABN0QX69_MYCUL|nr:hypothetical protein I551_4123 [Mycobacterium ulcerans str. Harvey]